MTTPQARKLIGKKVQWTRRLDHHRGTYQIKTGTVEEVAGRNIRIDGDWKWLPDLDGLKEVTRSA